MLKNIFTKRPISIDKFIKYQNDIVIDKNNINKSFIISSFFNNNSFEDDEISNMINVNSQNIIKSKKKIKFKE